MRARAGIIGIPGIVAEFGGFAAKEKRRARTRPAGVLPFCFRREPVRFAGKGRKPSRVFHGGMVSDIDGRLAFAAEAEGFIRVRRRGVRDGVGQLLGGRFLHRTPHGASNSRLESKDVVLVPSDFGFSHPERVNGHPVRGAFVLGAAGFTRRTAHVERPAGNRRQVEMDFGSGNGFRVELHLRRQWVRSRWRRGRPSGQAPYQHQGSPDQPPSSPSNSLQARGESPAGVAQGRA